MKSKMLGGILLVVGTTIGAGMLALPVATAELGFWGSLVLLVSSWVVMTTCAFLFLEVNLWLPPNSNLISMAGATLGKGGQVLAWFVYLCLLYSILSAYMAGGGDLFHYVLTTGGVAVSASTAVLLFTCLFGLVVYFGIRSVDYVNRGLMFGKLGALILLILLVMPFVTSVNLNGGELKYITSPFGITTTAVAFGCLMIIPSLRTYFGEDTQALRKAIWVGTIIPLVCYIAWDMVIMGVVPLDGSPGLKEIVDSPNKSSMLVAALTGILQKGTVTKLTKFFTSICMATSFLSISLSLSDFLSDGFSVAKRGLGSVLIYGATFLPPLLVVLFFPNAFSLGLQCAGISVVILMVLMPPLMAWRGRYHHEFVLEGYQVRGGKLLLAMLLTLAVVMIWFGVKGLI